MPNNNDPDDEDFAPPHGIPRPEIPNEDDAPPHGIPRPAPYRRQRKVDFMKGILGFNRSTSTGNTQSDTNTSSNMSDWRL